MAGLCFVHQMFRTIALFFFCCGLLCGQSADVWHGNGFYESFIMPIASKDWVLTAHSSLLVYIAGCLSL